MFVVSNDNEFCSITRDVRISTACENSATRVMFHCAMEKCGHFYLVVANLKEICEPTCNIKLKQYSYWTLNIFDFSRFSAYITEVVINITVCNCVRKFMLLLRVLFATNHHIITL